VAGKDEIIVRVIPARGALARQLLGAGRRFSPDRDAVAELVAERSCALCVGELGATQAEVEETIASYASQADCVHHQALY
jgi:hypothetical protein